MTETSMQVQPVTGRELTAREQWLEDRRRGIGGSDAAAILGVNPYAGPLDVWLEKRGEAPPRQQTEAMWWGQQLEPLILRRYTETTGRRVRSPESLLQHPAFNCLVGTPDGLVVGQRIGVEAKTASRAEGWGEPGTDDIPHPYLVQCIHYMAITGFPAWDVVVLIGASDLRVYRIHRDKELEQQIIEQLVQWWRRHMEHGERPPLDASDGARQFVHARFPRESAPLAPAPPEAEPFAQRLARARIAIQSYEAEKALCETNIKALVGEAAGLTGAGWRATWKLPKGRRIVDWEAAARALSGGDLEVLNAAIQAHTQEVPATRRFLFTLEG